MLRKALIALAAVGTLATGMTSLSNTASANIVFQFGTGYGFHHGAYWRHWPHGSRCYIKTIKVRYHHRWVWRNVKVCRGYPVY